MSMSKAAYEKARRLRLKKSMTPEEYKVYCKVQYKRNSAYSRYRSLLVKDKKRGYCDDLISYKQFSILIRGHCNWCTIEHSNGVDRLDSDHGHTLDNCVPCCEKCNILLTDLPFEAKCLLAPGLKAIRSRGIFERWEVPYRRKT